MMLPLKPSDYNAARDVWYAPFKPVCLRQHEGMIHREVDALIGFIEDGKAAFVTRFAAPLSAYVTAGILRLPTRERSDM